MATPRKTPGTPNVTPSTPSAPSKRTLGIAARDAALKAGVDPKGFSLDELIAWHQRQQGGSKPPQPAAGGGTPPEKAGAGNKPATNSGTSPPEKAGGGRRPSAKENQRIYNFLVTNGTDKKTLDKMNPEERKARYDQMLEDAKTGAGDPARAKQDDVLEDPPEEPIKPKGGGGGRRKGGSGKPAASKPKPKPGAKAESKPQNVRPEPIGEMDDPDLEGDDSPTESGDPKKGQGLSGMFGGAGRAKDWKSWAGDMTQGMPEKMGYFQTPGTLRAAHALSRRPLMAAAAAYGGYKLGVEPLMRRNAGGQEETAKIPENVDGYDYWDRYDAKSKAVDPPPAKTDRFNETPWWEKGEQMPGGPYPMKQTPLPADQNTTSVDIIRRLRGTA